MTEEIRQKIFDVYHSSVKVLSNKGNLYNVRLSDRVRLTMTPEIGDTAIIKIINDTWIVTDIEKKPEPQPIDKVRAKRDRKEIMELIS